VTELILLNKCLLLISGSPASEHGPVVNVVPEMITFDHLLPSGHCLPEFHHRNPLFNLGLVLRLVHFTKLSFINFTIEQLSLRVDRVDDNV
jgi:hypothetical protein